MESSRNVTLENHIKLFVEAKIGERVLLEFSTDCVYVKPHSKQGSTTLGAFWVRVIQCYFPRSKFSYKKGYSSSHGSETLSVSFMANNCRVGISQCLLWYNSITPACKPHLSGSNPSVAKIILQYLHIHIHDHLCG